MKTLKKWAKNWATLIGIAMSIGLLIVLKNGNWNCFSVIFLCTIIITLTISFLERE